MIFDPILDLFRGKAVTIPPLDGALKPNTALEDAPAVLTITEPDNLVTVGGEVLFTSGNRLLALRPGAGDPPVEKAVFAAPITALAAATDGTLAIGLESGALEIRPPSGPARSIAGFNCPVALAFDAAGELLVCNGSDRHAPGGWVADLMEKGATGSLWRVRADGECQRLAGGLAFPFGVAVEGASGRIIVSEAWRHRLLAFASTGGTPTPILTKLPGYPGRLSPRAGGGMVLCLFAPRNRLIEFVLLEDDYRRDMMVEIDPRHWIAPALAPARSFLEPLQSGGVKTMGIHKPWAPSRSYGLVVELDRQLQPLASHHSRANGRRHGVTSVIERDGLILAAARGGDVIVALTPTAGAA